jgi:AcrR family transcriptional regulator
MVRPKKSEQTANYRQAILDCAWRSIALEGAGALSLRAIARELGITAPAIYNYFARRDDLVTALIVDAFQAFGDAQISAVESCPDDDFAAQLRAAGRAYRAWALANPQRYLLIFGSPIPGYHAPTDLTVPAAARALSALIGVLERAWQAGKINPKALPSLPAELCEQLAQWRAFHAVGDEIVPYLAVTIWTRVHGLAMLEVGGQYPAVIRDPGLIYNLEIELLVESLMV